MARAAKKTAAPQPETTAPDANETEGVKSFELSETGVDVTVPLEGDDATRNIDYSKTTMNVVNDAARDSDES